MGKIKKSNILFVILVGMSKDEVLNKKINIFLPDTIAHYHDSFFKNHLNREEEVNSHFLNIDNSGLFVKNKSGFLVPITVKVKLLEDNSNLLYMGTFKPDTQKKVSVNIICRKDGIIVDISASAISILNLNLAQIKKSKLYIDEIVYYYLNINPYKNIFRYQTL